MTRTLVAYLVFPATGALTGFLLSGDGIVGYAIGAVTVIAADAIA